MNWDDFSRWTIKCAKGKSQKAQIFKLVYAEMSYHIWIEGNIRIFEHKSKCWEDIAKEISYVCCARASSGIVHKLRNCLF